MATSLAQIYVPNLGSGILIPTLPIGRGPSGPYGPNVGAVNFCHATDDVLPMPAAVRPVSSTVAENGHLLKNSAGCVGRPAGDRGCKSLTMKE